VNLCSRNSPYSLNCHVGAMLVFRMLCRITQSSDVHRTESVSVMDHEQTMGVNSPNSPKPSMKHHFVHETLKCTTCFTDCTYIWGSQLHITVAHGSN